MRELSKGYDLELRAHRLVNFLGFFCRRRINIYSSEGNQITDIDVIGIKFNSFLNPEYILIETKSEKGFASILKLKGLLEYFNSNIAYIIRPNITPDIIRFSETLDIHALHTARLDEIEDTFGIPRDKWIYSYSHENDYVIDQFKKLLRENKFRSQLSILNYFWEERDPFYTIKILIDFTDFLLKEMNKNIEDSLRKALRYLLFEHIILFVICILRCCNELFKYPTYQRRKFFQERLISGKLSFDEKENLLDKFYSFIKNYSKISNIDMKLERKDLSLMPIYENNLYDLMNEYINNSKEVIFLPIILDLYESQLIKEIKIEDNTVIKEISISEDYLKTCKTLFGNTIDFLFKKSPNFISNIIQ